jgi:hypothetical protein
MDRFKINNRSMKSLEQSWMRTKSKSFEDYKKAMDLKAIKQYCMGQRRKYCILARKFCSNRQKLNWSKVMDGTTATTHNGRGYDVLETVHSYNLKMAGYKMQLNTAGVLVQRRKPRHMWLLTAKVLEDSMLYAY